MTAGSLRRTPNPLAPHYARFGVAERLLLTGHSHQAWPDVAREAQLNAFDDAAEAVDDKWERAAAKADEVREGFRRLLGDPGGHLALGANTHELVVRFLSALDVGDLGGRSRRPRLVTTTGEFHSLRRQLTRLAEADVEVVWVDADPVSTLAERLAAAATAEADGTRTLAVLVSAVLFETARLVPGLDELAAVCEAQGVELVVDAYHALGCVPFDIHQEGLTSAWVVGGGYKYLQLGEGNCFLRIPQRGLELRPVVTGWFAEFDELAGGDQNARRVTYAPGADRFAGATYDPTSHYRGARVFRFFATHGLTPALLRASYLHQVRRLSTAFDALDLPATVITRDRVTPPAAIGGFLAVETPHAARLHDALRDRGVHTDQRGRYLRFGPAPYLSDAQLDAAMAALGEAAATL